MADRLAYTPVEVAQMLGCSASRVRKMVNDGDLPSLPRRGPKGLILIPAKALEEYVARAAA